MSKPVVSNTDAVDDDRDPVLFASTAGAAAAAEARP